jgi:hypothetical protein
VGKQHLSDQGMAALMGETSTWNAQLSDKQLANLKSLLCDVAQVFDGWHIDTAWTEWDQSVRRRVSAWQRRLERI